MRSGFYRVDKRGNELLSTRIRDIASKLHKPNNIGDFRDLIRRPLKNAEVLDNIEILR